MTKAKEPFEFITLDSDDKLSESYKIGKRIGKGSFGTVYEAIRIENNLKCCLKKVCRQRAQVKNHPYEWLSEVSILYSIKHVGIIELRGVIKTPMSVYLIMELCEGGSLTQHIKGLTQADLGFDESIVREIIRQLTTALVYLHNRSIVHRDVKTDNVLLFTEINLLSKKIQPRPSSNLSLPSTNSTDKLLRTNFPSRKIRKSQPSTSSMKMLRVPQHFHFSDTKRPRSKLPELLLQDHKPIAYTDIQTQNINAIKVKLIDFGMAIELKRAEEAVAGFCGTPLFMAPEVLAGRLYTRQCDVWSLGVIAFQLLTKKLPFSCIKCSNLIDEINYCTQKDINDKINDHVSPLARDWLICGLNTDPIQRLSAAELLRHDWLLPPFTANQIDSIKIFPTAKPSIKPAGRIHQVSALTEEMPASSHTSIFNVMKSYRS